MENINAWIARAQSNSIGLGTNQGATHVEESNVDACHLFRVAAWQIYDIASATEVPGRAVMILQYVLLAGLLLGIAGSTYNALRARQE